MNIVIKSTHPEKRNLVFLGKNCQVLRFDPKNTKNIVIDSNLLIMYFIGSFDPGLIANFKRTRMYAIEDFETLSFFLKHFRMKATTPNILTEVFNLSNSLQENIKEDFFLKFRNEIKVLKEFYIKSSTASSSTFFPKLGLTDSSIIHLIKNRYLLITDDFKLSQYSQSCGLDALNFNHIRTYNWKWQI